MSEKPAIPLTLPPAVRVAIDRVKATFGALSRPVRILLATTVIAAAVISGWLAVGAANEPYALLFTRLDADDAGAVVAKLKELKSPYRLSTDGGAIEVPEARVHELRLELATAGLPRGGGVGFEAFDKMRLGATEFEQHVLFRRALEGELSRTIGTVGAVQSARVHIVLPEKSVFVSRREPASASVVLRLRSGRTLGTSEVAAVVHLVASAIPGLSTDKVTLVTTDGTVLHRPKRGDGDGSGDGDLGDVAPSRAMESGVEERVRAMLDRILGPGHSDVRVSADMDAARVERTEEHWDGTRATLRSEESTIERGGSEDSVAGVPGAESNPIGEAADVAEAAKKAGVLRESKTKNYEVDRVTEKRTSTQSAVRRLTVAVVVDTGSPLTKEKMNVERIASLVRTAAGIDEKRGDVVTVEATQFVRDVADDTPPPPEPMVTKYLRAHPRIALGVLGGLVLLAALVAVALARRRSKRLRRAATLAPQLNGIPSPPVLVVADDPDSRRRQVQELAARDPATAALVLRHWLGTAGEEAPARVAA